MKKLTSILLTITLLCSVLSIPTFASTTGYVNAIPTSSKIFVNGVAISADAYNIKGDNYFKLRDLAKMLSGQNKEFEIKWDSTKNAINLITNKTYTTVGGELVKGDGKSKNAYASNSSVYINDVKANLTAFLINGNNYFKLRDVMQLLNIGVTWNAQANAIEINTKVGYNSISYTVDVSKYSEIHLYAGGGDLGKKVIDQLSGGNFSFWGGAPFDKAYRFDKNILYIIMSTEQPYNELPLAIKQKISLNDYNAVLKNNFLKVDINKASVLVIKPGVVLSKAIQVYKNNSIITLNNIPILDQDKVLLPLEETLKGINALYEIKINTSSFNLSYEGSNFVLKKNSSDIVKNGSRILIGSPVIEKNNVIYVPLDFFEIALGLKTKYNKEKQQAFIFDKYKLKYDIAIEDFSKGIAKITMYISNIDVEKLLIREVDFVPTDKSIQNFKVYDSNGEKLDWSQSGFIGHPGGNRWREWTITTSKNRNVKVEYEIVISNNNNSYHGGGYIGNDYATFCLDQLILCPSDFNNTEEDIELAFNVPNGSTIATPFIKSQDKYIANIPFRYAPNNNTFISNKIWEPQSEDIIPVFYATTAIGNFDIVQRNAAGITLSVVVPKEWNDEKKDVTADSMQALLEYYVNLFGKPVGKTYMAIYTPPTLDGYGYFSGESSFSYGGFDGGGYFGHGHIIFHRYNGFDWGWNSNRNEIGYLMDEGVNRYYEAKSFLKIMDRLDVLNNESANMIELRYKEYLQKDRQNDIAYISAQDIAKADDSNWTAYIKGSLFCFALDMKIMEDTNGQKSFDDLIKAVYAKHSFSRGEITYSEILSLLNSLTGKDYTNILHDYMYGTNFLDLNKYFLDDDKDGLPNYVEIIRGTDPNVYDEVNSKIKALFQ